MGFNTMQGPDSSSRDYLGDLVKVAVFRYRHGVVHHSPSISVPASQPQAPASFHSAALITRRQRSAWRAAAALPYIDTPINTGRRRLKAETGPRNSGDSINVNSFTEPGGVDTASGRGQ